MRRRELCAVLTMLLSVKSFAQENSDEWKFSITPYLWLPTISGTLKYHLPPGAGGNPSFDIGPTDWLDLLNFGALVGGSARKGKFSISTDLIYLNMSREPDGRLVSVEGTIPGPGPIQIPVGADITLATETGLEGLIWDLVFGYSMYQTDDSYMDAIIGTRYFDVDVSTSWSLSAAITTPGGTEVLAADGSIDQREKLWDGIIGIRGQYGIANSRWAVPYYLDVGAGSSDRTWNAMAALTYEFNWGELMLVYRHLEYDQDPDGLLQGFSFSGPAFGARFTF